MKKIIYSLILIFCMTAASASAEAAIGAKVDSANDKIIVSGTVEPNADVPLLLLKPLGSGITLSASNLNTYAVHITSATADGTGAFSKDLPMLPGHEGVWYTLLTESGSTSDIAAGLKIYYPSDAEQTAPLAAVNAAADGAALNTALSALASPGVKNADALGVSITCAEYANHQAAFCNTLFATKPAGSWLTVAAFQADFEATVVIYKRHLEALDAINGATLETITSVLTSYNDVLNLTLSGKYATYSSAINKNIVGTYTSLDAFRSTFSTAVTNYQPPQSIINGGGGGGGGTGVSGLGNGGGLATDIPVVITPPADKFSDLGSVEWAKESIIRLANEGIVSGTGDYKFSPNDLVTREQFVKMILLALDFDITGGSADFSDVDASDWYYSYVMTACELGIITGKDNGSFGAGENVTREDMVAIAARAVAKADKALPETSAVDYTDFDSVSDYAKDAATMLGKAGVITGMPDGSFMPKEFSTRAQAAVVLDRLMQITKG